MRSTESIVAQGGQWIEVPNYAAEPTGDSSEHLNGRSLAQIDIAPAERARLVPIQLFAVRAEQAIRHILWRSGNWPDQQYSPSRHDYQT
jgi:hypothetical protein